MKHLKHDILTGLFHILCQNIWQVLILLKANEPSIYLNYEEQRVVKKKTMQYDGKPLER